MKRRVTIIYECGAPPDVFKEEKEVSKERWEELMELIPRGLPCDGGGVPGTWCTRQCRWSVSPLTVEDEIEGSGEWDDEWTEGRI